MCGLVFMGSKSIGYRDVEVFEEMLFCDTLRGSHSTGVCGIFEDKEHGTRNKLVKAAVPGPEFIASGFLDEAISIRTKNGNVTTIKRPIAAFGHNRYATKGEVNAVNAHPFTHDHITLAHNGTLTGQHRLIDHKKFEVDSENIAYSISKVGFVETLKNLDGAFTLIWHDSNLNTVNIIRNKERPFYLVRTSTNDWFGASEKEMLLWIMGRQKSPITVAEQFECEPGVQYVFDVTNGVFSFKEKVKHELPTFTRFPYSSSYSNFYGDDYDYDYWAGRNRRNTQTNATPWKTKEEEENKILKEAGLRVKNGDFITFKVYGMEENSSLISPYCTYRGYVYPDETVQEYFEVEAHGQLKSNFKNDNLYTGKIVKVARNTQFGMVTITVGCVSETTVEIDISDKTSPISLPAVISSVPTVGEEILYNKLMNEYYLDLECGDAIYFEAKGLRHPISSKLGTGIIYGNCIEVGLKDVIIDSVLVDTNDYYRGSIYSGTVCKAQLENNKIVLTVDDLILVADSADNFKIVDPQTEDDGDDEVIEYDITSLSGLIDDDDVPFDESRLEDVQTLKTGEVFTYNTWKLSHHHYCSECGKDIPFEEASQASINFGACFCKNCTFINKEKKKELTISESTNEVLNKHNLRFRHGESLDFVSENFMPYGSSGTRGSLFGETSSKIRVISPDFNIADFYSKSLYTGLISSARESGDEVTIYVTNVAIKSSGFFHCECCHNRKPAIQRDESNKDKYICLSCSQKQEKRKILSLVKTEKDTHKKLINGNLVTKIIWESKMGSCKQCECSIPWSQAHIVTMVGGVPLCKSCESKIA